jgi:orotate phosphoribosyltransferase
MPAAEEQLLQLLKERAFSLDGPFRLASGGTSPYYIDGKMIEVYSRGARLIGEILYQRTKDLPLDAIGGLEVGAVPLTTAAVLTYHLHGRAIEGFWVRDEIKAHGTRKLVEGKLKPGSRVAIVDDVVTKGGSVVKAVQEVKKYKCQVVLVVALVDRLAGAARLFAEHGIENYRPVFTIRDLGVKD